MTFILSTAKAIKMAWASSRPGSVSMRKRRFLSPGLLGVGKKKKKNQYLVRFWKMDQTI